MIPGLTFKLQTLPKWTGSKSHVSNTCSKLSVKAQGKCAGFCTEFIQNEWYSRLDCIQFDMQDINLVFLLMPLGTIHLSGRRYGSSLLILNRFCSQARIFSGRKTGRSFFFQPNLWCLKKELKPPSYLLKHSKMLGGNWIKCYVLIGG